MAQLVSFFDQQNDSSSWNFVEPGQIHQDLLTLQPLTKTKNTKCVHLKTGTILEGTFKLQGSLLAYFSNENQTSPNLVLDLLNTRLKASTNNSNKPSYTLTFTKDEISFELIFRSEIAVNSWMNCLKPICISSSVDAHYTTLCFFEENYLCSTYLAQDKKTLELFALKRFLTKSFRQIGAKTMLLNQMRMARSFNHPNIMRLSQIVEDNGSIYFVKSYDPNESLEFLLREANFPVYNFGSQIAQITKSILQGLDYIASRGAILQNLNLGNVVINKQGQVKIIDFIFLNHFNMVELFHERNLIPGFIAPEVFKYNKAKPKTAFDEKSNVFSVGCILFEMLFGFPLFDAKGPTAVLRLNKSYHYSDASNTINKELNNPESFINKQGLKLLLRLLEPDSTKRISIREALCSEYFRTGEISKEKGQFIHSIGKIRSKFEMSFPSQAYRESPSSVGVVVSTGINTFSQPSKNNSQDFVQLDKAQPLPSWNNNLSKLLNDKSFTSKTASFANQCSRISKCSEKEWKEDLSVDFSDEIKIDGCNVKAFLDSHCIKIAIKNPGKPL